MADVKEKDLTKVTGTTAADVASIIHETSNTPDTYVRMVDKDGKSVDVRRDSFMAAIRECLNGVLSDQSTNATNVLSMLSTGVLGKTTMSNLASVLGGVTNGVSSPFSFSIHHSGDCRNVTNSPVSYGVIMKCTLAYYPVWMAFSSTSEGLGAVWIGIADHGQNELTNVSWKKLQFTS